MAENQDSHSLPPPTLDQAEASPWKMLIALTLAAAVLRTIALDSGLWYDEIRTLVESVRSPVLAIVTVFPGDNQHTLFSILAHLSISAFGEHAWSLRLPSMLCGVATVPMLYLFAREFTRRSEAMLSALLLAVAYHHIWFSQSARGYAILTLLTLLSSWLLLRGLRRKRPADFVWYAVAAALGIYTHVTMAFLVVSHALLCLLPLGLPRFDRESMRRWGLPIMGFSLAGLLSVALYSPVLFEVRESVVTQASPMRDATPKWALVELLRGLQIGLGSAAAVVAGGILFAAGSLSYLKQNRFMFGLAAVPAFVTFTATVALHRPVRPRFVIFLAGFAIMILVRGALEIGRWLSRRHAAAGTLTPLGVGLVLVMCVLSLASLANLYQYPKQDFAGARDFVLAHASADEPILTASLTSYPYRAYYGMDWRSIESLEDLNRARSTGRPLWVLNTMTTYVDSELLAALSRDCRQEAVFRGTVGGGDVTVCRIER
jgi:4-amino-4-deoxy-L-arabinose transferase-like glycosyltransferase